MNASLTASRNDATNPKEDGNELRHLLQRISLDSDPNDPEVGRLVDVLKEKLNLDFPDTQYQAILMNLKKATIGTAKDSSSSQSSTQPATSGSDQEGTSDVEFSTKDQQSGALQATWSTDSQSSRGYSGNESQHEKRGYDNTASASAAATTPARGNAALLNLPRSSKRDPSDQSKGSNSHSDSNNGIGTATCSPIRPKHTPKTANKFVGGKRTPSTNARTDGKVKRNHTPNRIFGVVGSSNNMAYVSQTNTGLSSAPSPPPENPPARLFRRIKCGKSQRDLDFDTAQMNIPNSLQPAESNFSSFDPSFADISPVNATTPAAAAAITSSTPHTTPASRKVQAPPSSPSRPGLQEQDDAPPKAASPSAGDRKRTARYKFPSSEDDDGAQPILAPRRTASTSPGDSLGAQTSFSPAGDSLGPQVQTVDSGTTSSSLEYSTKTPSHHSVRGDFSVGTPMDFSFVTSPPTVEPQTQPRMQREQQASTDFLEKSQQRLRNINTPAPESFRSNPLQHTPAPGQTPVHQQQSIQTPQNFSSGMVQGASGLPNQTAAAPSSSSSVQYAPSQSQPPVQSTGFPTQIPPQFVQPGPHGQPPSVQYAQSFHPLNPPTMYNSSVQQHQVPHQPSVAHATQLPAQNIGLHGVTAPQQPVQPVQTELAQNAEQPTFSLGSDQRKGLAKNRLHKAYLVGGRGSRAVQFPVSGGQITGASSSGSESTRPPVISTSVPTTQVPLEERLPSPMNVSPMNVEMNEPGFSLGSTGKGKSRFKLPKKLPSKSNNLLDQPLLGIPSPQAAQPDEESQETKLAHIFSLVEAKREEAHDAYMCQDYRLSIHCYTLAIESYRSFIGKPVFDGDLLANLLDSRAKALMLLDAVHAASEDCREAIRFVSDGGPDGNRFSAKCGPPFKLKIMSRLVRALLRQGSDREAHEVAQAALVTVKETVLLARRLLPKIQSDECIQMLGHTEREIKLHLDDVRKVQQSLDKVRQLLSNNNFGTRWSYAEPLKHVNLALAHEDASDDLIGTKVRLLTKMKRWREASGVLERYAALKIQYDGVFVGDLESRDPFPGVEPAQYLKLDVFGEKSEEDPLTAERKLNSRSVAEAILRLPYALTQIYVRALRLEERYPAAESALNALEFLVNSGTAKHSPSEMKQKFHWLSVERDRLLRTKDGREKGDKFFQSGKFEEATTTYRACLQIDNEGQRSNIDGPNVGGRLHAVLHCNAAAALMAMGNYEEALEACSAAINIHSRYMKAMLRRARCYDKLRRFRESISEYERWLLLVEEAQNKSGPHIVSACLFDCPKDATEKDIKVVRRELEAVHVSKRRAEAVTREEASRMKQEREKWNQTFSNARTAQERREDWYKQDSRRWDSFSNRGPNRSKEYKRSASAGQSAGDNHPHHNYRSQSAGRSPQQSMGTSDMKRMDHYTVLNISVHATEKEIEKAYRKLALKYHPDKNKDPMAAEQFRRIGEARDVLTDGVKRRAYDMQRAYVPRRH